MGGDIFGVLAVVVAVNHHVRHHVVRHLAEQEIQLLQAVDREIHGILRLHHELRIEEIPVALGVAHHRRHQGSLDIVEDTQVEIHLHERRLQAAVVGPHAPNPVAGGHLRESHHHGTEMLVALLAAHVRHMQLDAAHIVPQTGNLRLEARHHMRLIRRQAVPAVRQLLDTLYNALRLLGLLGHRQHIDIRFQNHGTPLVDTRLVLSGFHARQLAVERELLVHHHIPIGG